MRLATSHVAYQAVFQAKSDWKDQKRTAASKKKKKAGKSQAAKLLGWHESGETAEKSKKVAG